DIRIVPRWREAPNAVSALGLLPGLSGDEVVLETGRAASGVSPGGSVRILEKSPELLSLATSSSAPAWLFVLRGFWSYRDVRVDGRPVHPVPAQLAFTAIALPPGEHRVVWREEIPGIRFSWIGPVLFAVAAVTVLPRRRGRAEAS